MATRRETSKTDRSGQKSFKKDVIIVGSKSYVKIGGGSWQLFPVDLGSTIAAFRDSKIADEIRSNAEVKFVGPETLDGAPMLVYQYTISHSKALGADLSSDTTTWVAVADGLPRKSVSDGEFAGVKSKSTTTWADYNADIKIEPPLK
jgi:hypothetical protein